MQASGLRGADLYVDESCLATSLVCSPRPKFTRTIVFAGMVVRIPVGLVHLLAATGPPVVCRRSVLMAATGPPAVCRRNVIIGGAAAATSVIDVSRAQPAAAAEQPATAAATARMSREDAVVQVLSRVPVFVVANQEGLPYLTETNKAGKRSGSIYVGLREAVALLEAVRVYDVNATLAVVPLASIFSTAAKSSAQLERQVAASVENKPDLAGQRGPVGLLAEAGHA